VVLALLLIGLSQPAAPPEETLRRAQQLFEEGLHLRKNPVEARKRFRAAAEECRRLQPLGIHNELLYRNEGNAWLLAGEVPRAILAYRRGLRLRPADGPLQQGLAAAREAVARKAGGGLGRPPSDDRPPWLPRVGFSFWSLALVLIVYTLSWLCLARWAMLRVRGLLIGGVSGLLLSLGTAALLGLVTLEEERQHARPLVVIAADDLPLRRGNGEAYSSRYAEKLPRGAEGRLLHRRGDWLQIELSRGEVGWVPVSAVLVDDDADDRR